MTTIQDTLTYADGSLVNGRLVVWWKPFTIGNVNAAGGEVESEIVNGVISISLYPNAGAQPQGVYYNAKYELESGAVYTEQWIVPNLPTVNVGQVRVSFPPTPSVMISPLQLTSLNAQGGMFLQWDGTRWVPAYPSTFNMNPNWVNIQPGTSGNDVNITGSPVSVGNTATINIPDAGPTARGVVTTGAQTFAGNKTFQGAVSIPGTLTVGNLVVSGSGVVTSVFGRAGAVVAVVGDYTAAQVTNAVSTLGSYANPAWITSLAWSKITGAPATGVGSVFGRAGAVVAQAGDYTAAQVTGAVVDPTTTLGDLLVRGASAIGRLPVGNNGQVLTADNTQATFGVRWTSPAVPADDTSTQRVQVGLAGAVIGTRHELNFIAGSGTTLNVVDNSGANRVDITVSLSGTGPATPSIYSLDGTVIGTRPQLNLVTGSNVTLSGLDNNGANRVDITIAATGGGTGNVASVFGRTGAVVAVAGDYTAAQVTNAVSTLGSYADPAWITSLSYSKLTGVPANVGIWQLGSGGAIYYNGGNVGIGTAAPQVPFSVRGVGASGVTPLVGSTLLFVENTGAESYIETSTSVNHYCGYLFSRGKSLSAYIIDGASAAGLSIICNDNQPLFINTGGAERMRITSAGNVGIGTTNPVVTFHVVSGNQWAGLFEVTGQGRVLLGSTATGTGAVQGTDVSGNPHPLLLNPSGGNVGIGTTNPLNLFTVRTGVDQNLGVRYDSGASMIGFGTFNDAGTAPIPLEYNASRHYFAGGNVGIGTANPQSLLDLGGSSGFKLLVYGNGGNPAYLCGVGLNVRNSSNLSLVVPGGAGGGLEIVAPLQATWPYTSYSPLVLITNTGNVGIGTISPGSPLTVVGTATTSQAGIFAVQDKTNPARNVWIGYDAGRESGWIQALINGVAYQPLLLNPNGGSVGINTGNRSLGPATFQVHTGTDQNLALLGPSNLAGAISINAVNDVWTVNTPLEIRASLTCFTIGRVGIGMTGPSSLLEVSDNIVSSSSTAGFIFRDRSTNADGYMWYGSSGNAYLYNIHNGATPISVAANGLVNHSAGMANSGARSTFSSGGGDMYVVGIQSQVSAMVTWLGTDSNSNFFVANSGGSQILYVCPTGVVGILKVPAYTLDVNGDCNITGTYRVNGAPITTGGGITVQNVVTGSRAFGTVYQNTTGKVLWVSATGSGSSSGLTALTDSSSNPTTTVQATSNGGGAAAWLMVFFPVLPNNYYKVTVSGTMSMVNWTEWN